jgi:hypothetical protein
MLQNWETTREGSWRSYPHPRRPPSDQNTCQGKGRPTTLKMWFKRHLKCVTVEVYATHLPTHSRVNYSNLWGKDQIIQKAQKNFTTGTRRLSQSTRTRYRMPISTRSTPYKARWYRRKTYLSGLLGYRIRASNRLWNSRNLHRKYLLIPLIQPKVKFKRAIQVCKLN